MVVLGLTCYVYKVVDVAKIAKEQMNVLVVLQSVHVVFGEITETNRKRRNHCEKV
jgi:hypothetical protein